MNLSTPVFQKLWITLLVVFLFASATTVDAQDSVKAAYTRNVVWTTPVKRNTTINGLAIGFAATTWRGARSLNVNGLNVELQPLGIIVGMYALGGTIASLSSSAKKDSTIQGRRDLISRNIFTEKDSSITTRLRGVSLSLGGLNDANVSGISVNGIVSFVNRMNGIELTGIMNLHYEFNGLMIAGLRNKVTVGRGVQIGLINTCKSGRLVQLGLINRIGKRITPIINFSFKRAQ